MEHLERPVTKAIVGGETVSERLAYRTWSGRTMPVSVTVSPVLLDGKPAGAIEIFRDISVEIQSERLKTDFISIASHQLRTPLSAISLYAQMLSDGLAGKLNEQQQSFLETTIAATKRMNDLISTLLNITRIEAGSIAIDPRPTELVPLIEDLMTEFTPEAERKSIGLRFGRPDDEIALFSDPLLIREVLSNLVSNAIKYTPEHGTVTVSLHQKGSQILCSVQDTGYGIPAASQQYIFTKFFRADNIIAQDVSGTGLGLYLTKTIVENLQGELWFDSQEDEGSIFYMSLPKEGIAKRAGSFKIEA
jgi:signal transduction histidine kinase